MSRLDFDQVCEAAASSGKVVIFLVALQRALNFVSTQLLLRHVEPHVLGVASIPLDLLLNTSLFLSREGFRLGLSRQTLVGVPSSDPTFRQFINLGWLPALLGLLLSGICFLLLATDEHNAYYRPTASLFCLAASIESLSEPIYLLCQAHLITSVRVVAEGLATLIRSFLGYCLVAHVLSTSQALLGFGLAQLAYAIILSLTYWLELLLCKQPVHLVSPMDLLPDYLLFTRRRVVHPTATSASKEEVAAIAEQVEELGRQNTGGTAGINNQTAPKSSSRTEMTREVPDVEPQVNRTLLILSLNLTAQSFFKHLLTQGDKIVLSFSSHYDQGLYALAQNYGSLAARLLFMPLEESARLLFSRLTEQDMPARTASTAVDTDARENRALNRQTVSDLGAEGSVRDGAESRDADMLGTVFDADTLSNMFVVLFKVVTFIGLFFACLGVNYTRVLIRLLHSNKWASEDRGEGKKVRGADAVLGWYCVYVLLLAVNGMTEAFVYATVKKHEVSALSTSAFLSFLVFAALAYPSISVFGTTGVILANGAGMLARIVFSLLYINRYFKDRRQGMPAFMPHSFVQVAFVVSLGLTRLSDSHTDVQRWTEVGRHVAIGVMCALGLAAHIVLFEWKTLASFSRIYRLGTVGRKREKVA